MVDEDTLNGVVKRIDFKLYSIEMSHNKLSKREKLLLKEFLYDIKGDLMTLITFDENSERKVHVDLIMKYIDTCIDDLFFVKGEELKKHVVIARKILFNAYKDVLQPKKDMVTT